MTHDETLHAIIQEALAARSALCENELVIRLDTIVALARTALDAGSGEERSAPGGIGTRTRKAGRDEA